MSLVAAMISSGVSCALDRELAGLDAGEVDKVFDQARHALGLAMDALGDRAQRDDRDRRSTLSSDVAPIMIVPSGLRRSCDTTDRISSRARVASSAVRVRLALFAVCARELDLVALRATACATWTRPSP